MNTSELFQIIQALEDRLTMLRDRKARWDAMGNPTLMEAVEQDLANTQRALEKIEKERTM